MHGHTSPIRQHFTYFENTRQPPHPPPPPSLPRQSNQLNGPLLNRATNYLLTHTFV